MQIMYNKKHLTILLIRRAHTQTHTPPKEMVAVAFIDTPSSEGRWAGGKSLAWTFQLRVVLDDRARRDSNPQHDAAPSTRYGG